MFARSALFDLCLHTPLTQLFSPAVPGSRPISSSGPSSVAPFVSSFASAFTDPTPSSPFSPHIPTPAPGSHGNSNSSAHAHSYTHGAQPGPPIQPPPGLGLPNAQAFNYSKRDGKSHAPPAHAHTHTTTRTGPAPPGMKAGAGTIAAGEPGSLSVVSGAQGVGSVTAGSFASGSGHAVRASPLEPPAASLVSSFRAGSAGDGDLKSSNASAAWPAPQPGTLSTTGPQSSLALAHAPGWEAAATWAAPGPLSSVFPPVALVGGGSTLWQEKSKSTRVGHELSSQHARAAWDGWEQ